MKIHCYVFKENHKYYFHYCFLMVLSIDAATKSTQIGGENDKNLTYFFILKCTNKLTIRQLQNGYVTM